MDITMMSVFKSLERSEGQWRTLISSVQGLRIIKIWGARETTESTIEIERI